MAVAHVVERLNGFLDAALEIDAARVGLVEAKGHFLRAIAGERAAFIFRLCLSANNAHHFQHSFPLIFDISTRRCVVSWSTNWPMNFLKLPFSSI